MPSVSTTPEQSGEQRLVTDREQKLLDLLARTQKREGELEAIYTDGHATAAQLAELERIRTEMDEALEALGNLGYFNPT